MSFPGNQSPRTTFIYSPANPAGDAGNRYTVWADLVAVIATVEGVKVIEFDDSFEDPIVIPAGASPMPDTVWAPHCGVAGGGSPLTLDLTPPCTFDGLCGIGGPARRMLINPLGFEDNPYITNTDTDASFVVDNARITAPSGDTVDGAFFSYNAPGGNLRVTLLNGAEIDNTVNFFGTVFFIRDGTLDLIVNSGVVGFQAIDDVVGNATAAIRDDGGTIDYTQNNTAPGLPGIVTNLDQYTRFQCSDFVVDSNPATSRANRVNFFDTSGGAQATNLPSAVAPPVTPGGPLSLFNPWGGGMWCVIKKTTGDGSNVTITPALGDTIDGQANLVISAAFAGVVLVSDGGPGGFPGSNVLTGNWWAIARF